MNTPSARSNKALTRSLPGGWLTSHREYAELLHSELQRELPTSHPLHGATVSVIAHRDGTDDILCKHHLLQDRFTVVHLTWLGRTEVDAHHPAIECDGTFADFLDYEARFGSDCIDND